jgi:cyclopropane-fatty-acyl-phospholipid synthase
LIATTGRCDTVAVPALIDRVARRIALAVLDRTRHGTIVLVDGGRRYELGEAASGDRLRATIVVRSPRFYRLALRGSIGLAQGYRDGVWECAELPTLMRIAAVNASRLDPPRRALLPLVAVPRRLARWLTRNTPRRSRRQIAAHYDLGNGLFAVMLDETMTYSCAVFAEPQMSLAQAQRAKLELVCRKLALSPRDRVLEIGSGWGAFAIHAAHAHGCNVTTTTLSREQHDYVSARVAEIGLADRIAVLERDYRELDGSFDKLVCIEMIEAVGWQYLDTFFARCSKLLRPRGAMLLQAITIDDRAYEVEKSSRSFIKTQIFPGGCLPSQAAISRSLARVTDLRLVDLEDITAHYVETLRRWRTNIVDAGAELARLGYDEPFRRVWELYLSYCEGGFSARRIGDVQMLLAKPGFRAGAAGV